MMVVVGFALAILLVLTLVGEFPTFATVVVGFELDLEFPDPITDEVPPVAFELPDPITLPPVELADEFPPLAVLWTVELPDPLTFPPAPP